MLYSFEDVKTGEAVELAFSMAEAPAIGAVVVREGRRLRRLPEADLFRGSKEGGHFANYQISRRDPAAAECDFRDARGTPCWRNRDRAREWGKRQAAKGRRDLATDFDG